MSRHPRSQGTSEKKGRAVSLLSELRSQISNLLEGHELQIRPWTGSGRVSRNLLEINTDPQPTVLYVKESNSTPGFWGITKNQVDRLHSRRTRWFVVLLARRHDHGYLLTGGQVDARIENGTFELSGDGDYKINEGSDLSEAQSFRGLPSLLPRVL